jgi:diguanylate cyclase (GGDEF)-like protein
MTDTEPTDLQAYLEKPEKKCSVDICPADMDDCRIYQDYLRLKKDYQRLQKLSIKDDLTGYYNYAFLMTTLSNEMERTRRSGLSCAIIMADIDHFKIVNDEFGHEAGNLALKRVSSLWKQNIRKVDFPCRYGGEEFLFILPNETMPQAIHMAKRLRIKLETDPLRLKGKTIFLTASFGVHEYNGLSHHTPTEFIEEADRILYKAKQAGRNCVLPEAPPLTPASRQISMAERMILYGE